MTEKCSSRDRKLLVTGNPVTNEVGQGEERSWRSAGNRISGHQRQRGGGPEYTAGTIGARPRKSSCGTRGPLDSCHSLTFGNAFLGVPESRAVARIEGFSRATAPLSGTFRATAPLLGTPSEKGGREGRLGGG